MNWRGGRVTPVGLQGQKAMFNDLRIPKTQNVRDMPKALNQLDRTNIRIHYLSSFKPSVKHCNLNPPTSSFCHSIIKIIGKKTQ